MDLFASQGGIKCTLWPASRKMILCDISRKCIFKEFHPSWTFFLLASYFQVSSSDKLCQEYVTVKMQMPTARGLLNYYFKPRNGHSLQKISWKLIYFNALPPGTSTDHYHPRKSTRRGKRRRQISVRFKALFPPAFYVFHFFSYLFFLFSSRQDSVSRRRNSEFTPKRTAGSLRISLSLISSLHLFLRDFASPFSWGEEESQSSSQHCGGVFSHDRF